MAKRYEPPKQGRFGQFFDSVFLMVLVFLSLGAPLLLQREEAAEAPAAQEQQAAAPAATWDELKQNPTQQAQWERLGYTAATAKPIVEHRFDYTIEPVPLIVTIVVIVAYFLFLLRWSDREYKDVIGERFGKHDES